MSAGVLSSYQPSASLPKRQLRLHRRLICLMVSMPVQSVRISDEILCTDLSMYCLKTLVEKLKPRTGKTTIDERVNSLICFSRVSWQNNMGLTI